MEFGATATVRDDGLKHIPILRINYGLAILRQHPTPFLCFKIWKWYVLGASMLGRTTWRNSRSCVFGESQYANVHPVTLLSMRATSARRISNKTLPCFFHRSNDGIFSLLSPLILQARQGTRS